MAKKRRIGGQGRNATGHAGVPLALRYYPVTDERCRYNAIVAIYEAIHRMVPDIRPWRING